MPSVCAASIATPRPAISGKLPMPVECATKRRLVMSWRDSGFDREFLGARPRGMADFLLSPRDQHHLATPYVIALRDRLAAAMPALPGLSR